MRRSLLIPLAFLASPALAEPYDGTGYALGCDDRACTIWTAGIVLTVADDGSTPGDLIATLRGFDGVTAVTLSADLGELGDITAPATLTALTRRADDPYEDTLRFIQGEWRPRDEESPFSIRIDGLNWTEMGPDGPGAAFLIGPGAACADGTEPGGIALSLVELGGPPDEAACWQIDYATETELDLTRVGGEAGSIPFDRVIN